MPPSRIPSPALASIALTLLASLVPGLAAPLAAATIAVDTLADNEAADGLCSLREAIQAANDDLPFLGCPAGEDHDLVTLDLTGTIALTADLPEITRNLTLAGPASGTLTLNGGNHRMLEMNGAPNGKTLRIERLTIRNGLNPAGGGCISIQRADRLELVDSRVTGCETPLAGGAIFGDNAAALSIQRSRIEGNSATQGAGGVYLIGLGIPAFAGEGDSPTATLVIEDSTISDNSVPSEASGGGVAIAWANGEIRRSTLSANSTQATGGGLVVIYGTVLVESSTLTLNSADINENDGGEVGGGIYAFASDLYPAIVQLHNSVIAGNTGASLASDLKVGDNSAILSDGFNLIGVRNGADALFPLGTPNANDDWVGSRAAPVIAGLAALADNGGRTPTHAPSPGSLLVDRGECPDALRDQRGYGDLANQRRPVNEPVVPDSADGCDIGAFEAGAEELPFVLFVDGFASGDTSAWSSALP